MQIAYAKLCNDWRAIRPTIRRYSDAIQRLHCRCSNRRQKGAVALGYNAEVVHEQEAEAEEVTNNRDQTTFFTKLKIGNVMCPMNLHDDVRFRMDDRKRKRRPKPRSRSSRRSIATTSSPTLGYAIISSSPTTMPELRCFQHSLFSRRHCSPK
jgi:hypothetical protein